MLYDMLVAHCSPTLAGIKTGNLFSCKMDYDRLLSEVRELNKILVRKNICLIAMKHEDHTLVYMYRPDFLKRDLSDSLAIRILNDCGYSLKSAAVCVGELSRRLKNETSFPHEIGLFLDYPPADVDGFIKNNARHAKCTGMWKVYGDVRQSQIMFERYKDCTARCMEGFRNHCSIDKLAVAVS
ncbi:MAG: DUF3793 family protein [Clostridiales bacterium]|nr:DUF3793 family protein [Clostridiales bacterium]